MEATVRRQLVLVTSMLTVALLALSATSARAQDYPPAFPRNGAKKVLDNDMVNVWDVTWEKGKQTAMNKLRFDEVSVALSEGAVRITRPDKTSTIDLARPGSVRVESKGTVALEEGLSDTPRRSIVVEIKSYMVPKLDPKIADGLKEAKGKGIPGQFPREGTLKLLENDSLILWDDTWPLNGLGPLHAHYESVVGVFIEAGVLAPSTIRSVGDVVFSPPRMPPHQEEAIKGPPRAIFIQFKQAR
jgi:hypothetical protein